MREVNKLWAADVSSRLFKNRRIEGDCWLWTGGKQSTGYGMLKVDGVPQLVHRLAAELWLEEFDSKKSVSQTCQNPLCFNPKHMLLNAKRKADNYAPKLDPEKVATCIELYAHSPDWWTIERLANSFNCSYSTMWKAVNGITWRGENADKGTDKVLSSS